MVSLAKVMSSFFPAINQRVFLETAESQDAGRPVAVACLVQDVGGHDLLLLCPASLPDGGVLARGRRVFLSYARPRGLCRLEAEVVEVTDGPAATGRADQGASGAGGRGPWPWVRLRVLSVNCDQRRRYFRWRASLPARYALLGPEGEGGGAIGADAGVWRTAETVDISAGGVRMRTREPLEEGALLLVRVSLPEGEVEAMGRVVRTWEESPGWGAKHYQAGVDFTRLTVWGGQAIMRFVFSQERRLRRWGLS